MSEEVWVRCEICGKGFDSYEALVSHLYSHIDELEQKLQKWFDKYRVEWIKCPKHLTCTQCKDAHYCEFQSIVKDFQQLLKENQRVERK
jgi:hypothetical protein